jgi:hypothetical protein
MTFNCGAAGLPGTWLFFHGRRALGAALVLVKFVWLYLILEHFPAAVGASVLISLIVGFTERDRPSWTVAGVIAIVLRVIVYGLLATYYRQVGSFNIV